MKGTVILAVSALALAASVVPVPDLPPEEVVRQLREARIAIALGERERGVELLKRTAGEHPREILPILALIAYYRGKRSDETELAGLRSLLRGRLLDPEAKLPAASLRQIVEDPDIAKEDLPALRHALELRLSSAPDDVALLDALARVEDRLEDREAARATLGRIAALRPDDSSLWPCVRIDRELERWESVLALLGQIRAKSGDSPWVRMMMIEALGKLGRYEEIMKELETPDKTPGSQRMAVGPLLQAAWSLRDAQKEAEAEKVFRKVMEIDPENAEARDAVLYFYAGEKERASERAALDESWRNQKDPDVLQTEGVSRLSAGDALGAYDLLKRAAEALGDSETAWFNFGLASMRLGRWEEARQAMARSVAIAPAFANAHLDLGAALQKLGRCPEAMGELKKALSLDPHLSQAHSYLYNCYVALGEADKAAEERKLAPPPK